MTTIPSALQFIFRSGLFHFRGTLDDSRFELITDLEVAKAKAWAKQDWTDFREDVSARSGAWQTDYDLNKLVRSLVSAYSPQFEDGTLEQLEAEANFDLTRCASYTSTRARPEDLYPLLLLAYEAGGWPCGWSGEYPPGKLCVYLPSCPPSLDKLQSASARRVAHQKRKSREALLTAV